MDRVEDCRWLVIEEGFDVVEGAVVKDLYFSLVELGKRAEEKSGCLSDQLIMVGYVLADLFYVLLGHNGCLAFFVE